MEIDTASITGLILGSPVVLIVIALIMDAIAHGIQKQ